MSYYSDIILDAVNKYPPYDKDMYFIVHAYNQWKNYILGKQMVIQTNPNTL